MPSPDVLILILIISYLPILGTALYSGRYHKRLEPVFQPFSYFLYFSAIVQAASTIIGMSKMNNMPLLHLYVLVGFLLLTQFYKKIFAGYIHLRVMNICAIGFAIYSLVNSFFFETWLTYNAMANAVQGVIILIFSIAAFLLLLQDIVREEHEKQFAGLSWINAGFFIYYASTLLLFYFGQALNNYEISRQLARMSWLFHSFFIIVQYSFFGVGLWKQVHR